MKRAQALRGRAALAALGSTYIKQLSVRAVPTQQSLPSQLGVSPNNAFINLQKFPGSHQEAV